MLNLEQQLDDLLGKKVDTLINRQIESLRGKIAQYGKKYVLFGAGHLGKLTLARLRRAEIEPVAFTDNNPNLWNTLVDGLTVLSPQEAVDKHAQNAVFVNTVYTSQPVWEQLSALNLSVISFAELAWIHKELMPHGSVEYPYRIFKEADQVKQAFSLWADEISRQEYIGQLIWRTSLDRSVLPVHLPQSEIYFADDLITNYMDEVFVDCGAFDGDTIQEFIKRRGDSFKKIFAIEPDPFNVKALETRITKLPPEFQNRVQIIPNATGSTQTVVTFNVTGTAGSSVGSGSYQVESKALDDLLASTTPTFIKMDIEGAEPDTILGTRSLIAKHAPVLAICLYHAQEHLWQIPLLIQSIRDDYNLFLRRYADECWEIVCYAIPKNRTAV